MSMMVSFVLSFFPRDVLDEILNLIESVSEDFPSYSSIAVIINVASSHLNGTSNYNTNKHFYLRKIIDLKTVKKNYQMSTEIYISYFILFLY